MSHKEIETYGIYPQFTINQEERELQISKIKKMKEAHSQISNVLNKNKLTYKEIKKLLDVISKEADSFLQTTTVTFKVQK